MGGKRAEDDPAGAVCAPADGSVKTVIALKRGEAEPVSSIT